jgi:amino acid adenylation domain-containing protein
MNDRSDNNPATGGADKSKKKVFSGNNSALLLAQWNNTRRDYPEEKVLHQLFEDQVKRTPDAVALVFGKTIITYRELNQEANRIARFVKGISGDSRALIGVFMERSVAMVSALYGILKAGCAYVPVDPEYPEDRISFMLENTQTPVVLTQAHLTERISKSSSRVIAVDGPESSEIAKKAATNLQHNTDPDDLAYVIYTSGSTGQPKGAMNTHRAICNRLLWMQEEYRLTEMDRVLQKTPFSFDVSVWEFFWPLLYGAQLVIAAPGGHRDSSYLVDTVIEHDITTMHFVPSMLNLFLDHPRSGECRQLKRVICSGEALPKSLQDRFFARLQCELHNLYGPTEAAVDVTAWQCLPNSGLPFVPIGRPIANTQIHVLDQALKPVPVGEVGELYIGGVQVGIGYLRRPELTAERFIDDPFHPDNPQARLYKTGDLARWHLDGFVEYLGRSDFQVKIRGFRVELGEIEAAIESFPSISQSVVVANEGTSGDKTLVAYFVHDHGADFSVEQLKTFLRGKLPEYMVPPVLMVLESFPLSPNGKIDRKALPPPPQRRRELCQTYVAPRDNLEKYLAEMWTEILGVDRVGTRDRFFELGGTSLQAARLVNRLEKELGEPVFVVTLFSAPTIEEYAAFLRHDYATALGRRFGEQESLPVAGRQMGGDQSQITNQTVALFLAKIPKLVPVTSPQSTQNPSAAFVLAPPRSGTSLLRIMLAGHPDVFAASELQLLGFQTMAERMQAYQGRFSLWLDGAVRAVMQLKNCGPDEAKHLINAEEQRGTTTKQFYWLLQQWSGDRLLVDKSPSYALDADALNKAEQDFNHPFYIHLVRHPQAVIPSFLERRMDQALYLYDHDFTPRQLAELVWTVSHQTIINFLAGISPGRYFRVKFEDMVTDPRTQMEQLCTKLEIEFNEQLLNPYDSLNKKMANGVYAESTPMDDKKFFEHGRINPDAADFWKTAKEPITLGEPTKQLAEYFGYQLTNSVQTDTTGASATHRRRSLESQFKRRRNSKGSENV